MPKIVVFLVFFLYWVTSLGQELRIHPELLNSNQSDLPLCVLGDDHQMPTPGNDVLVVSFICEVILEKELNHFSDSPSENLYRSLNDQADFFKIEPVKKFFEIQGVKDKNGRPLRGGFSWLLDQMNQVSKVDGLLKIKNFNFAVDLTMLFSGLTNRLGSADRLALSIVNHKQVRALMGTTLLVDQEDLIVDAESGWLSDSKHLLKIKGGFKIKKLLSFENLPGVVFLYRFEREPLETKINEIFSQILSFIKDPGSRNSSAK